MTFAATERLITLLRTNGVKYFKSDHVEIRMEGLESPTMPMSVGPVSIPSVHEIVPHRTQAKVPETAAAAPPVEMKIRHEINQVASMLKMSDEQLVDALFPESQQQELGE